MAVYVDDAATREQATRLGAVAISRHHDRALVRSVIRNAKQQWRVDTPAQRH